MNTQMIELQDKITELAIHLERMDVLAYDVQKEFVAPMDFCDKTNALYLRILADTEAHRAEVRLEILIDIIDKAQFMIEKLEANITGKVESAQPPAEAASDEHSGDADATEEETRQQMTDEYMTTICNYVDLIQQRPDFIHRMLTLVKTARTLAAGSEVADTTKN